MLIGIFGYKIIEAELACKSEADVYTNYVMTQCIVFFALAKLNLTCLNFNIQSLYYRKPNLLARVRLMVIHTM